ncbi:MAG: hypothetical protein ABI947_28810 [Chloroflexota bacterium]
MSTLAIPLNTPKLPQRTRTIRHLRKLSLTLLGIALTALFLFPFYMILNFSFMQQTDILRYPPPLVPPQVTLDGYLSAFASSGE